MDPSPSVPLGPPSTETRPKLQLDTSKVVKAKAKAVSSSSSSSSSESPTRKVKQRRVHKPKPRKGAQFEPVSSEELSSEIEDLGGKIYVVTPQPAGGRNWVGAVGVSNGVFGYRVVGENPPTRGLVLEAVKARGRSKKLLFWSFRRSKQ